MPARHLIGLDIGSKFVKAVQITETSGTFNVTEFAVTELTPQMPVADAIIELFARRKWKTKRVVTSVSGRFVFVRYINMPFMTDEELANAAKYELGKYIPVEVDEVLHDSQKLEELPAQEGQEAEMRVLLVAAKRTFIDEHVGVLESSGLLPAVVDVDSFALGNAYELAGLIQPESIAPGRLVALVDIGASKTNINIMSDAVSYFTREFYKGGDDLTEAISKKLSLEMREAEALKRTFMNAPAEAPAEVPPEEEPPEENPEPEAKMTLPAGPSEGGESDPFGDVFSGGGAPIVMLERGDTSKMRRGPAPEENPQERVQDAIGSVIDDICHDINISIDYFENQYDKRVDEVFITGGASNTGGLQEALERTVQKPVNRWNPVQHLNLQMGDDSSQEIQDYASMAAIALGLASRLRG